MSQLCRSWKIPCTLSKRPVLEICKEKKLSRQEGARQVRYTFFQEAAKAHGARWIALGHTADDQAETFLINLLRGAGQEGFSGIPKSREEEGRVIIRPMLSMTRSQILAEMQEAQIRFMEDCSNQDKRFLRNRIRHELIPLLQTYNPNIKKTLVREANLIEEESSFLKGQVRDLLPKLTLRLTKREVCFDLSLFCSLHLAVQRRLIRWGIGRLHGTLKGVGFNRIDTILTKIQEDKNIKSHLPYGLSVQKTGRSLILKKESSAQNRSFPSPPPFEIPKGLWEALTMETTVIDIPQWKIRLSMSIKEASPPQEGKRDDRGSDCFVFLDFDTIPLPLTLRGWTPGDRFVPLGMQGRHKKLQDFFVDIKIPKEKRGQVPILVCPTGIVWVMGYRINEYYRVTQKTKRILSLEVAEAE